MNQKTVGKLGDQIIAQGRALVLKLILPSLEDSSDLLVRKVLITIAKEEENKSNWKIAHQNRFNPRSSFFKEVLNKQFQSTKPIKALNTIETSITHLKRKRKDCTNPGSSLRSKGNTFIAIICSGVGATTLGACGSSIGSKTFWTSPGENVFVDSFLASSSTSLDENSCSASNLSYHPGKLIITLFFSFWK